MIRLVTLLRRKAGCSGADYKEHLVDTVGPLVAGMQSRMGLARYVQLHADPDAAEGDRAASAVRGCDPSPFDCMADYWWPSSEVLAAQLACDDGVALLRQIGAAQAEVVEQAESLCWLAMEFPQVATGPGHVAARERTPLLRRAFPLMPRDGMSEADARDYWLLQHGPLVRSHSRARGMVRYTQVHRREGPMASQIAGLMGIAEGRFMGHAEAWFDRSVARVGPDFEAAKAEAAKDERRFIDLPSSFLFSGKEYPFVERDWIV